VDLIDWWSLSQIMVRVSCIREHFSSLAPISSSEHSVCLAPPSTFCLDLGILLLSFLPKSGELSSRFPLERITKPVLVSVGQRSSWNFFLELHEAR
jgi:hypothetical protein